MSREHEGETYTKKDKAYVTPPKITTIMLEYLVLLVTLAFLCAQRIIRRNKQSSKEVQSANPPALSMYGKVVVFSFPFAS